MQNYAVYIIICKEINITINILTVLRKTNFLKTFLTTDSIWPNSPDRGKLAIVNAKHTSGLCNGYCVDSYVPITEDIIIVG